MKNFGKLKGAINCVLANSVLEEGKESDKKNVKSFLKEIKKNDLLKTEYIIYTNLEEAYIPDRTSALEFVKENISFLNGFGPKKIINEHAKFAKKLNDSLKSDIHKYAENYADEETKNLHENISKLLQLENKPANLNERIELIDKIADFVQSNKKEEINESQLIKDKQLPNSVIAKFALDKFNKKYGQLEESEKKAVRAVLNDKDEEKTECFKDLKFECLEKVNGLLKEETDIETKDKLLKAKERLLNMKYSNNDYVDKVNKIITLKNELD